MPNLQKTKMKHHCLRCASLEGQVAGLQAKLKVAEEELSEIKKLVSLPRGLNDE